MPQIPSFIPFLKRSLLPILSVCVFFIAIGIFYFVDTTFRIQQVNISANPGQVPVAGILEIKGKYIFLTSEKTVADIITRTNPSIKSVIVARQYPNSIQLSITRYEPVVYLKSQDGYFLLTEEAIILGKSTEIGKKQLPVISYYQSIPFAEYQAGQQLPSQDIRDSIFFLKKMKDMGIRINSIDIAGFHMLGLYTEDKHYYFSSEKERNIQVYHLEQAIKRFKNEESDYKSIDVRFEKPVITF